MSIFTKLEQNTTDMVASLHYKQDVDDAYAQLIFDLLAEDGDINAEGRNTLRRYLLSLKKEQDFTYTHSVRVSATALQIASWLNMGLEDRKLITLLGLLHDIGKLGMPESLLNKTGKLTDKEFDLLKAHPEYSAKWLNAVDCFSDRIIDTVASHHEKVNGGGYPLGKSDKDLDTMTKILTIADIYEALSSKRPYKTPYPLDRSINILESMVSTGEIDARLFNLFQNKLRELVVLDIPKSVGSVVKGVDVKIVGYDNVLDLPVCQIMGPNIVI